MTTCTQIRLEEEFFFNILTKNNNLPIDADSLPTFEIRPHGSDTVILTGTSSKKDDPNTVGYYEASFTPTEDDGFEVGKTYTMLKKAIIDGNGVQSEKTFKVVSATAVIDLPDYNDLYNKVLAIIQTRLPDILDYISAEDLYSELLFVQIVLYSLEPCTNPYDDLGDSDKVLFERALALYLASLFRPLIPYTSAITPLQEVTIGTDTFVFAKPAVGEREEVLWIDQSLQALRLISCVLASQAWDSPVFALAGRRRTARKALYGSSTITSENPLYQLMADVRQQYEWRGVL